MKTVSKFFATVSLGLFLLGPSVSLAEGMALPPCMAIKKACETVSKKGAFSDCSKRIMEGGSVPGVVIASDVVAKCKEKK